MMDLAEQDLDLVHVLLDNSRGVFRGFGFFAQQATEKAAKAWLLMLGDNPGKTHDIALLFELLARRGIQLPASSKQLLRLQYYAVEARYGEADGDQGLSRLVVLGQVEAFMAAARAALGRPAKVSRPEDASQE